MLLCVLLLCGCGAPAAETEPSTTAAPTEAPLELESLDGIKLDRIPGSIPLSNETRAVIAESVNNALKTPLAVTESAYKD